MKSRGALAQKAPVNAPRNASVNVAGFGIIYGLIAYPLSIII